MQRSKVGSSLKDIAKLASGSVLAQLFTVAMTPLVTRLYDPAAYAAWAIVISIVVVLGVFATLRFELAVVLPKEHDEAAPVACLAGLLCLVISLLSLPLFFFEGFSRLLLSLDGLNRLYFWVPALTALTGVNQIANYWCTRTRRFSVLARAAFFLAISTVAVQALCAWGGQAGAEGLLCGTAVGTLISILYQVASAARDDARFFRDGWRWTRLRQAAVQYSNYPRFMAPYTLVGVVRDRFVLFFLGAAGSPIETGYYAFANRIVNLPVSLVSSAIRPVIFRKASLEGLGGVSDLLQVVMRAIVLVVTPFWVFLLFWAPELFALVFGARWREAGVYAVILAFPAYAQLLANWLDRLLDVVGKQRLAFGMESVFSLVSLCLFAFFAWRQGSVRWAVAIQAAVITLYNFYWIFIIFKLGGFAWRGLYELVLRFCLIVSVSAIFLVGATRVLPFVVVASLYGCALIAYLVWVCSGLVRRQALTPSRAV